MKKLYFLFVFILGFLLVFSEAGIHTFGDWSYVYPESAQQFPLFPTLWSSYTGLPGAANFFIVGLDWLYRASSRIFIIDLHLTWDLTERLFWFLPLWLVGIIGSIRFGRRFSSSIFAHVASLFVFNSYFFMIIGGGQMGVAWGYAIAPWVVDGFFQLSDAFLANRKDVWRQTVCVAIVFAIQLFFDARMAYMTLSVIGLYVIWILIIHKADRFLFTRFLGCGMVFAFSVIGLHAFWLLPLVKFPISLSESLGAVYTSTGAITFFSFADFSHALSLLHPNWPENIFGKVYFLQPEFLVLPILAYASLLFLRNPKSEIRNPKQYQNSKFKIQNPETPQSYGQRVILFFALLGLLGAFLAKGSNPPFGGVYLWLFERVPGFVMFRDPTKFYLLIVLSYAVLIPFTLEQISLCVAHLLKKKEKYISLSAIYVLLLVPFVLYWGFAHREAVSGKLGGTFKSRSVPAEYVRLKDYLVAREGFSRVLWVPARQRYGFYSDDRPGLSIEAFGVASASSFIAWIGNPEAEEHLKRYGVTDVVVPTDPLGELFVTDREVDDEKRKIVVSALRADPDVTEISGFGDIAVFQTKSTYGHVYFTDASREPLVVRRIAPAQYELILPSLDQARTLVFSESYDPYWELVLGTKLLSPHKTKDGLQEYQVEAFPGGRAHLRYRPQQFVYYGSVASGITVILLIGYLSYEIILMWKRKRVLRGGS